jgi:imidazole glycerol-phosphate synthase subunit HisF
MQRRAEAAVDLPLRCVRLIARLDIKGPDLVKGVQLEGLRVLGRPEAFARRYYLQGADELIYMDVVASLYGRNSLLDIVTRTSESLAIPLTVGGGLRTLDDIQSVLRAGADKVALNTAALADPELIRRAAERFGSSTIVVSIEAKQTASGYEAYTHGGRERTGTDAIAWAAQAAQQGAGEILLTSIDRDGTGRGYDLELVRAVTRTVTIPVIACGGAGSAEHVVEVVGAAGADAVGVASILHYESLCDRVEPGAAHEGNTEFLRRAQPPRTVRPTTLAQLRARVRAGGLECREATP